VANPFLVKDSIAATVATTTTWFDSSSNSLDLTATNSPTLDTLGDATSEYNPFWTLDGVDQYLTKSNDANLNFGEFTDFSLEILFRANSTPVDFTRLIEKGDLAGKFYALYLLATGKVGSVLDDNTTQKLTTTTTSIDDELWHHVIAVFDRDGNLQIYLDGTADGSAIDISAVGDIDDATEPLTIGIRSEDEATNPFEGDIALARIWNRALSSGEVSTQYNGGDFWKVQAPTADQWGSQAEIIADSLTASDSSMNGGIGSWAANTVGGVITSGGGATNLSIATTAQFEGAVSGQVATFTAGKNYEIRIQMSSIIDAGWLARINTSATNPGGGSDVMSLVTLDTGAGGHLQVISFVALITSAAAYVHLYNGTSGASDTALIDWIEIREVGAVAEYRLVHTNSFSPFEFEKARFLPASEPSVPRQISGPAGGGQVKVASLGDDLENFPFRINRVSSTNKTNFEGFIKDSTVDRGLNTFVFVDESAIETTVRWLTPTAQAQPLNNIQAPGGRFNLVGNFRKEIT